MKHRVLRLVCPAHLFSFLMLCSVTILALLCQRVASATYATDQCVMAQAEVEKVPPQIHLYWATNTGDVSHAYIDIYRRKAGEQSWGRLPIKTLSGTETEFIDTKEVEVGVLYEYKFEITGSTTSYGYLSAGIEVPLVDSRGTVVLIVDSTKAEPLSAELARLAQDLIGDGWTVIRQDINPAIDTAASVKELIKAAYYSKLNEPDPVKAALLFGGIPVAKSGFFAADGHTPLHPWPADMYYGDLEVLDPWTDTKSGTGYTPNDSVLDPNVIPEINMLPNDLEIAIGRVDMRDLPAFTPETETGLLRQYLNKDHAYRTKQFVPQAQAFIHDAAFRNPEGFAQNGWRNFAPLVGVTEVTNETWTAGRPAPYLWAYACGDGDTSANKILGVVNTYGMRTQDPAVFTMLYGDYFGDWNKSDNLLRAELATSNYGLVSIWAGRPNWFVHHMGMGETIGYSTLMSQNNREYVEGEGIQYKPAGQFTRSVHMSLMGDPTLRLHPVAPVSNLTAIIDPVSGVNLAWDASPETEASYHVYRATSPTGPFTRLTASPVSGLAYHDADAPNAMLTYMVRAVTLQQSVTGTYFNASQGVFVTIQKWVQPDAMIRNAAQGAYVGNNTYQEFFETQQGVEQLAPNGVTAVYQIKIENDGVVSDTFSLTGTAGGNGWTVRYFDALTGNSDITTEVVNGAWFTPLLAVGESVELRVEVTPDDTVPAGAQSIVRVFAASTIEVMRRDTVKAVTTTPIRQPDLWIRKTFDQYFSGDNVFTLGGQTITQALSTFRTASYTLAIQNDGNFGADNFVIVGTNGGADWQVTYFDAAVGGNDITAAVTGAGWDTGSLATGAHRLFRVEVTATSIAALHAVKTVAITAVSVMDPTRSDTVNAVTEAVVSDIARVSISSTGFEGNAGSKLPAMDVTGRYVAFESVASNLVPNDTNGRQDIFVYDRQLLVIERISVSSLGEQGDNDSYDPAISSDGRYVVFRSNSMNLDTGDSNGRSDIFLHDRQTGITTRISLSSTGVQGRNGDCFAPTISADGRFIAYHSYAIGLVTNDTDTKSDIFVHDTLTGVTERVSVAFSGPQGTGDSYAPAISGDGRFVTFWSNATNLVDKDTNNCADVFVFDRQMRKMSRVSVGQGGIQANGNSAAPSISNDGRYVAFESLASNLVAGTDVNGTRDVFVHDRVWGITSLVSMNSIGVPGNAASEAPHISGDGVYIVFTSEATSLVTGDSNVVSDVFVHNRQTGVTSLVSITNTGIRADRECRAPFISGNGRFVAFQSPSTNLVAADFNSTWDIFIRDVNACDTIGPAYQPDLWLRNAGEIAYTGNRVFTVNKQTKAQQVPVGMAAVYEIVAENSGNTTDQLVITGTPAQTGWTVRYINSANGQDVTGLLTTTGWSTDPVQFEGGVAIRVEVTPSGAVPADQVLDLLVTATSKSNASIRDVVKLQTTRLPVSSVTLETNPPVQALVGTTVTLTATSSSKLACYRFFAMKQGETAWTQLRVYNANPTCAWKPASPGKYTLLVWARESNHSNTKDAYTTLTYTAFPPPLSSVSITADPPAPAQVDTEITITANAVGGTAPQYRFFTLLKGETVWTQLRTYGTSPTVTWKPSVAGDYTLLVWARETGSPTQHDVHTTRTYRINNPDPPVITLNPFATDLQNSTGVVSGRVTGYAVTRTEITVNGFTNVCTLNDDGTFSAIVVLIPGVNTMQVRATNIGGTTTSDVITYNFVPASDMFFRVTLTWDGIGILDLHTWGPSLDHSSYWSPDIASGSLDVTLMTADGPENFTCKALEQGRFRIAANSFYAPAGRNAWVRVQVTHGPNAGKSYTFGPYTFTASDLGLLYPVTVNNEAWWRPCDIIVSGELITAVQPDSTPLPIGPVPENARQRVSIKSR